MQDDVPEISMAILQPYRGQGLGSRLLWDVEPHYRALGVRRLSLSVDVDNPAFRLDVRMGYTVYFRRRKKRQP